MRPRSPRIPPLSTAALTDEQAALVGGRDHPQGALNIVRTLVQYPALFKAWMPFSGHVMFGTSLTPREREILVLRTGFLCRSAYEVAQHTVIARQVGLSDQEIEAVENGGKGKALSDFDRMLIKAADELVGDHCISDKTWAALSARYSREQMMDLVFTVANYTLVSVALNSFGVQIEADVEKAWKKGI